MMNSNGRNGGGRYRRDGRLGGDDFGSGAGNNRYRGSEKRGGRDFDKDSGRGRVWNSDADGSFGRKRQPSGFRREEPNPENRRRGNSRDKDNERGFRPRRSDNNSGGKQSKSFEKDIESEGIRLNRYISNAGVCSRREADTFIASGVVKINGKVVTELGTKVMPGDEVHFHDTPLKSERKVYILLNKPKNTVTTTDDPEGRQTVMDIVAGACKERVYPVGRLDRNTTGVLLLTNDGDLASKLAHPRFAKKKIYHVFLDKPLEERDRQKLVDGITLEDGFIKADSVEYIEGSSRFEVGIEIHSGRNRIVRRMFDHIGYNVGKLDRVYFAGLTKYKLPRGQWRFLTDREIGILKSGAYE